MPVSYLLSGHPLKSITGRERPQKGEIESLCPGSAPWHQPNCLQPLCWSVEWGRKWDLPLRGAERAGHRLQAVFHGVTNCRSCGSVISLGHAVQGGLFASSSTVRGRNRPAIGSQHDRPRNQGLLHPAHSLLLSYHPPPVPRTGLLPRPWAGLFLEPGPRSGFVLCTCPRTVPRMSQLGQFSCLLRYVFNRLLPFYFEFCSPLPLPFAIALMARCEDTLAVVSGCHMLSCGVGDHSSRTGRGVMGVRREVSSL